MTAAALPFTTAAPGVGSFGAYAVNPGRCEYVGHGLAGLTLFHTRRGVWNGERIDPAARAAEPWMRCTDVHVEGSRSWRCQLTAGHQDRSGATDHRSFSGHRSWPAFAPARSPHGAGVAQGGGVIPAPAALLGTPDREER